MAAALADVPGLVDLRSSSEMGNPEVQVRFDREKLARLGLDRGPEGEEVGAFEIEVNLFGFRQS